MVDRSIDWLNHFVHPVCFFFPPLARRPCCVTRRASQRARRRKWPTAPLRSMARLPSPSLPIRTSLLIFLMGFDFFFKFYLFTYSIYLFARSFACLFVCSFVFPSFYLCTCALNFFFFFQKNSPQRLLQDKLCVNFAALDLVGLRLMASDDPRRLSSVIIHLLLEDQNNGNCGLCSVCVCVCCVCVLCMCVCVLCVVYADELCVCFYVMKYFM